jgi:hypothetical protein
MIIIERQLENSLESVINNPDANKILAAGPVIN